MRREFLQLANKFKLGKDNPAGMWASEKLDGTRVLWDGGMTRGLPTDTVPWANIIDPKTGNRKAKIKPISTGLWSRYGNPIIAPDWWLNQLPTMIIDGELFAGRGNFQTLRSIVAKDVADEEAWRKVKLAAFGTPTPSQLFASGEIKGTNFHLNINASMLGWVGRRVASYGIDFFYPLIALSFEQELELLDSSLVGGDVCYLHPHVKLPADRAMADKKLEVFMDSVLDEGGEGIMLRKPLSIWIPKRTSTLLKLKPFTDDSGTITGFISGRKTNKGSKLLGLIGAVVLDYNGKRLELSGFTDEERRFCLPDQEKWAAEHPGEEMPAHFQGKYFKRGDTIEFRYRELSDDGIPKEARYARRV